MLYPAGEIRVRDGFVSVRDQAIPDLDVARQALAAIDEALVGSGSRRVLFDTRELPPPIEAVNSMYWEWVTRGTNHDRVALLVRSEMKRVEGNMRALAKGVQLRSFHDEA
ncbi:MAG: hypothetical protein KDK70_13545, partial [Myxococcales bacterium]|nr:hypothetical protein [Myxococcales bacterium]